MQKDPLRLMIDGHSNVREYLIEFKNIIGLIPKDDKWENKKNLQDYFVDHFWPHVEFEEKIISVISNNDVSSNFRKVRNHVMKDHEHLKKQYKQFVDYQDTDNDLIAYTISLIDKLLMHAAYEDECLIPVIKKNLKFLGDIL